WTAAEPSLIWSSCAFRKTWMVYGTVVWPPGAWTPMVTVPAAGMATVWYRLPGPESWSGGSVSAPRVLWFKVTIAWAAVVTWTVRLWLPSTFRVKLSRSPAVVPVGFHRPVADPW